MAIVLLSGGLDSAANLALSVLQGLRPLALHIQYGQRAAAAELQACKQLTQHYGLDLVTIDLSWLGALGGSSLTNTNLALPQLSLEQLDDEAFNRPSMQSVWVPNRNGLFLNVAASLAEAKNIDSVYVGFNREEAATFPDNSGDFLQQLNASFQYSTRGKVQVKSFTLAWDKSEILEQGLNAQMPLQYVWSCYESGPQRCWKCESCKRTERALKTTSRGYAWLNKLGGN